MQPWWRVLCETQKSSFFWQLDLGIPAMTKCCNQLDTCYETCGTSKYDCDFKFRSCLHGICSDINRSLGFVSKVQGEFSPLLGCVLWQHMVCIWPLETPDILVTQPLSALCFSVSSSQPVNRWQTLSTTQCGLLVAGLTWTARGQHAFVRERRRMNCDTEHYGPLDPCTDNKQSHGYFYRLCCIERSLKKHEYGDCKWPVPRVLLKSRTNKY